MWGKAKKGQALVINISDFKDNKLVRSPRSDIDTINIVYLLKQLRYEVTERHDLTAQVSLVVTACSSKTLCWKLICI